MTIDELSRDGFGNATSWMTPIFWAITKRYKAAQVGEIGTDTGKSTIAFAMAAKEVGGHVYTMDIADNSKTVTERLGKYDCIPEVTFLLKNSQESDFPAMLDVLFIDGDHDYDAVRKDYERHRPRVKPGGCIMLHDPLSWPYGPGRLCKEERIFVIPLGPAGLGIEFK